MAVASIPVDWSLAQQPQSLDYIPSAVEGAQAGQTLRGISALQGIDINNPDSLNKGIGNLVRAGAADQASALMGLQINRGIYGGLPSFMAKAMNPNGTPASAPASVAAGQPVPTDGSGQAATDPTSALHAQIATDARAYAAASPQDQATMKPQLEDKYTQLGIAKPDIDAALQTVSTPEGAAQFAAMHDTHAQMHASGQADPAAIQSAIPAGLQPPSPGDGIDPYTWAKAYLSHPELSNYEAMVKSRFGLDLGYTARAQAIMGPEFAQEADVRNAQAKAQQEHLGALSTLPQELGQKADLTPPVAGASPTYDVNGNHIGWHMPDGSLQAIQSAAQSQSGGTAAGKAPYEKVELPTQSGAPKVVTGSQFAAQGATAGPQGSVAQGPTPGAVAYQQGDAKNLTDFIGQIPGRDVNSNKIIANGQQVAALADQIKTGRFTGTAADIARVLPGHDAAAYAANAGQLAQALSGSFAQTLNGLAMPRLSIEAKSVLGAIPTSSSPQDQIKLYGAMMAATGEYVQAHDRFMAKYAQDAQAKGETPGLTGGEVAWNAGPGHAPIMANPEFQKLQVGGKPASVPFQYKGKEYIAVLPGLLAKPIIMPAT